MAGARLGEWLGFSSGEAGVEAMRRARRGGLRPFLVRFYDEDEAPHAMQDAAFRGRAMFLGVEGVAAVTAPEFEAAIRICEERGGQRPGTAAAPAWLGRRLHVSALGTRPATPGPSARRHDAPPARAQATRR